MTKNDQTAQLTPTAVGTGRESSSRDALLSNPASLPQPQAQHLRTNRPAKHRRTLWVWFAVVAVATAIWVGFRPGFEPSIGWLLLLVPVAFAGAFVMSYRRIRALTREVERAVAMLGRGEVASAAATLDAIARRATGYSGVHAATVYNLGVARLLLGETREALACFSVAFQSRYFALGNPLASDSARFAVSTCYSLLGDVAAAELWLEEGRRTRRLPDLPIDVEAEATLLCRRKQYREGAALLRSRWRELENVLPGKSIRDLQVLLAFAETRSGTITDLRTLSPGIDEYHVSDHAYRGAHWPDFQAYLADVNLAA